ncbi:Abi family protein [Weissella cibaria]|uniref:Abi family protein n=1 Tax=Weissella cibaria TaxID=137591 RepID=UPI0022DFEC34|nr:Abi family protein [Weissella cibaria]
MYKPEKPFTDIETQLTIMAERNLGITNQNTTSSILEKYGYYKIVNGYGEPFEVNNANKKKYIDDASFQDIYFQFQLDRIISRTVIPEILAIEQKLKTAVSYVLAKNYGVFHQLTDYDLNLEKAVKIYPSNIDSTSYLSKQNFNNNNGEYDSVIEVYNIISEAKISPLSFYRDHRTHIPPWILIEQVEFGKLNRLFNTMKPADKLEVMNIFFAINHSIEINDQLYSSFFEMLELVRLFRNSFAHNARFLSSKFQLKFAFKKVMNNLDSPSLLSNKDYKNGIGKGDFFSLLSIITLFSDSGQSAEANLALYEKVINNAFEGIKNDSNFSDSVTPKQAFLTTSGLPADYISRLKYLSKQLF